MLGRGVFASGEDFFAPPLVSKLPDGLRSNANPILRLGESQRGVRILSKRKRGMLLGARSVLIVPLQYKIQSDISSRRRYREESVPHGMLCAGGMRTPVPPLQTVFKAF